MSELDVTSMVKLLDLCCGADGWTKAFRELGFECEGVDIRKHDHPGQLYVMDIMDFQPAKHYDVVVASPPCTYFSMARIWSKAGYGPQHEGLDLIWRCFQIINEIKPRFWILENAKIIKQFIPGWKHIVRNGIKNACAKEWVLYGNFPIPGMFTHHYVWKGYRQDHVTRQQIPYPMAKAFATAINNELMQSVIL